ncbi:MAG: CHAT domain-containing protein [Bacteroidia bacterium]|nr:CHAT domain-containing protein [Bacteroidia bacterium]
METFLDEILQHMKKGRTNRAFKVFEKNIDAFSEAEQRSISVLESRFNRINEEVSSGFTDSSDARSELVRIDHGIFDIVSNFGKEKDFGEEEENEEEKAAPIRKILFLASNPTDTGKLRLGAELRDIEEGLKLAEHRDSFELESRFAVRAKDLSRAMLEEEPQIIHFSGHGVLLKESSEAESGTRSLTWEEDEDEDKLEGYSGGIALEDNEGKAKIVAATALGGLFELFGENIECVFLNACYSDAQANEIIKHVPYVIGMNTAVPDETAITFATGFYDALGAGRDIEFAFKLAKNRIALEGMPGADIPVIRKKESEEE